MKKTYKIMLIAILFVCFNIFQANYKVYSYTEEEAKQIINYTVVDGTLSEDEYDVKIESKDLIDSIKLPVIQASLESVLYESDGLTDINFLNDSTTNTNSGWLRIQGVVTTFYRVFLYLAAIIMITTLIYMAIIVICESYKPNYMPKGARMFRDPGGGNPEREIRRKAIFDQWIVAIVLIALITVIVNVLVYFTDVFANIVSGYEVDESKITVYVSNDDGSGYTFDTTIEGLIMFGSEYDWENYAAKNVLYIFSGIMVTVFKYFVYILFVIRMFIIAILVTAAPIVIIIDAYLKIARKKGIFRLWVTTFVFFALLKPVIAIVYYVLQANNFIQTFPLYILFVITVEFAAIILSIMMFIRGLRNANKAEQREYDEIRGNSSSPTTSRARMMQPIQEARITYQQIVKNLRELAQYTNYDAAEMSDYLDQAIKQIGESSKQNFVNGLYKPGELKGDGGINTKIINTLKNDGMWKDQFKTTYG